MRWTRDAGTSLTEAIVSTGVLAAGSLALGVLFVHGPRMQIQARNGSTATGLAVARLERLRMLPPTHAERLDGGSLTADVANHSAVSGQFAVRWVIGDGPAGTKQIVVRVTGINIVVRGVEIVTLLTR
jgi:hypothetical protein